MKYLNHLHLSMHFNFFSRITSIEMSIFLNNTLDTFGIHLNKSLLSKLTSLPLPIALHSFILSKSLQKKENNRVHLSVLKYKQNPRVAYPIKQQLRLSIILLNRNYFTVLLYLMSVYRPNKTSILYRK